MRFNYIEQSTGGGIEGPVEVIDFGFAMQKPKPGETWEAFPKLVLRVESATGEKSPTYDLKLGRIWNGRIALSQDGDEPWEPEGDDPSVLAPHLCVIDDEDRDGEIKFGDWSPAGMLFAALGNVGFPMESFQEEGMFALRGTKGNMAPHEYDDRGTKRTVSIFDALDPESVEGGGKAKKGAKKAAKKAAKAAGKPKSGGSDDDDITEEEIEIANAVALEVAGGNDKPVAVNTFLASMLVAMSKEYKDRLDAERRAAVRSWAKANLESIEGLSVEGGKVSLAE